MMSLLTFTICLIQMFYGFHTLNKPLFSNSSPPLTPTLSHTLPPPLSYSFYGVLYLIHVLHLNFPVGRLHRADQCSITKKNGDKPRVVFFFVTLLEVNGYIIQ